MFVGRARELAELEGALHAAQAGTGATVLVTGDAGIGKTRLASELAACAHEDGFEVLLGRAIDLVGTDLPYQPFVEALRPVGEIDRTAGSQLRVFEGTLELLAARPEPVLLVLEDLHWADTSTLDLVVFLAHNLDERRVVLVATFRADEPESADRMRRLTDGVRRSGAAAVLELGPLTRSELTELLDDVPLRDEIVARSEGNPFFAEELLAAHLSGEIPRHLQDVLLRRVDGLDSATQSLLRIAAAAGRDVGYELLCAGATLAEADVRASLRRAVEQRVLVADQAGGTFRFRHALLAEAIYTTILPGEREAVHAQLAAELARLGAPATELAPHWAAAGRAAEAIAASVAAAREAEAVFGLSEAHAHLERALALWDAAPDAAGLDLAELYAWTAQRAADTGAAPRAVELLQHAIAIVGDGDPLRAARLYQSLGRDLHTGGRSDEALAMFERAVELVPANPPSADRAQALAALGQGLMLAWRYAESLPVCEQALALARAVESRPAELRALNALGSDLAYVGRGEEGLAQLRLALQLAKESDEPIVQEIPYVLLTDVLLMLGRPGESARLAEEALDAVRPYGRDHSALVANRVEALVAMGDWETADTVSTAGLRSINGNYPHMLLLTRAELDVARGEFDAARARFDAAWATIRSDHEVAATDTLVAELALWERRWGDAAELVRHGLAHVRSRDAAPLRIRLCALALRAQAELAALARDRRDDDAVRTELRRARELLMDTQRAAEEAAPVTENAVGWRMLAEAEYARACAQGEPATWSEAAAVWDRLERPALAAYCRLREAEALVAAGAARLTASVPLSQAYATATRIGARPLAVELELLARRARLELTPPTSPPGREEALEAILGLTPREAEVLTLVARGYTNREIAQALVISVNTASVHVSHILRKLDAPNRLEAAAITHRLTGPQ